jgi:hypothetical protein
MQGYRMILDDMIVEKIITKRSAGVEVTDKDVAAKMRKFVGLPSGVDPKSLTQEAAVKIYQNGLVQKAKGAAFKGKRESTS